MLSGDDADETGGTVGGFRGDAVDVCEGNVEVEEVGFYVLDGDVGFDPPEDTGVGRWFGLGGFGGGRRFWEGGCFGDADRASDMEGKGFQLLEEVRGRGGNRSGTGGGDGKVSDQEAGNVPEDYGKGFGRGKVSGDARGVKGLDDGTG